MAKPGRILWLRAVAGTLVIASMGMARADAPTTAPAVQVAPPPNDDIQPTLEFPFGDGVGRGDWICATIKIGKSEHLFVVDTGASMSVLDPTIANPADERGKKATVTDAEGRRTEHKVYWSPAMEVGGKRLKNKSDVIVALDLDLARQAAGRPVMGILGMDVLQNYVVQLDFRKRVVRLIDPAGFAMPENAGVQAYNMIETGGKVSVACGFAGVPGATAMIDTGFDAQGNVARGMLERVKPEEITTRPAFTVHAGGMSTLPEVCIRRQWSLGQTTFENLWLKEGAFNVLGLGILSNFVTTLDFERKRMYVESIRATPAAWPPRLDFGIALKDGRIIIKSCGKAAVKAGMHEDDEVALVDGKPVGKVELWELRERLATAKEIVVGLKKGAETREIRLQRAVLVDK